ncbi:hypothetical protein AMK59_2322 [Oryctes borbonicus]|uniref:DNA/RNA non-specific endonuclease domain-containing protein n=1 Tax=Oryctes borbonicus TaxID=1629725 RepID=A0A0T6BBY3_9SCAR|nr:hypothetical protein AMK59_2322 [Oryctes borbonicus]
MFIIVLSCVFANVLNLSPSGVNAVTHPYCNISIKNDFNDRPPLLIATKFNRTDFVLPTTSSEIINVKEGNFIGVFCPGSNVTLSDVPIRENLTRLECRYDKFYLHNGTSVNFATIACSKSLKSVAQYTGKSCLKRYKEFEIGYRYQRDFLTLIRGCFDKVHKITLYTVSAITKAINYAKFAIPRKAYWSKGSFFAGVRINRAYIRSNQRNVINRQVGLSNQNSTKYISENDNIYYLSRGHLTPKTDFIYGPHQDVTFHFLNAVPQWQLLNGGNWKILEKTLRDLASSRGIDLNIYTGISGILSFRHEKTGRSTELYLHLGDRRKRIPVPKFVWKIAYDSANNKGIAFVGVNNPYLNGNYSKVKICANVCFSASYLHFKKNYGKYGYVYCCKVDEFRRKISTVPDEVARGLDLLT